ncbi:MULTISPECIES: response regulator [Barrientosiimonas]|uniref:DNA-binding response regulator n=1 Tax=Barrientosiimonas endolithica TaxID=1535208 RepID=A0ABM8HD21_9MICO|nr:response regulator transcription factor [Barrientosiimonas endolithica]BDZ58855.1 DNA-binding response regulator [Barrientosiimonas endolithica]
MAHRGPAVDGQDTGLIRVLVVDDFNLYRRGISTVLELEADIEVVGEAETAEQAVRLAAEQRPDVVLMDIYLPGGSGIEACAAVKASSPLSQVLMITASDDADDLTDAVRAGATGYLLKDVGPDELVAAIRGASRHESQLSGAMAGRLMSSYASLLRSEPPRPEPPEPHGALTEREREVLVLVARGLSNKGIGDELFISENTVKNHVRSILEKLELSSRVEAAMYAVRAGLVPDEPVDDEAR